MPSPDTWHTTKPARTSRMASGILYRRSQGVDELLHVGLVEGIGRTELDVIAGCPVDHPAHLRHDHHALRRRGLYDATRHAGLG